MAYKYREDLVGKRFLSVSGVTKINVNKVSEWGWKAGVIRAASLKDNKNKELQVLVEYDGVDWQRREWVAVYSRRTFRVFLVERTLVWAPRNVKDETVKWPALTFTPLAADLPLQPRAHPVECLHDRQLRFLDYSELQPFQEWDAKLAGADAGTDPETLTALQAEAAEWRINQDGQRILTTTPSVLGGCRAQVYRVAGATQWYTAVIVGVNEHTGELTVTDDTVLEEHSEDPALVQMRLLGDGVIESIMRGEVVGVMPRRSRSNLQEYDENTTLDGSIQYEETTEDYVTPDVTVTDMLQDTIIAEFPKPIPIPPRKRSRSSQHDNHMEYQPKREYSHRESYTPNESVRRDATAKFARYLEAKLNLFNPTASAILIHKINQLIFETEMSSISQPHAFSMASTSPKSNWSPSPPHISPVVQLEISKYNDKEEDKKGTIITP